MFKLSCFVLLFAAANCLAQPEGTSISHKIMVTVSEVPLHRPEGCLFLVGPAGPGYFLYNRNEGHPFHEKQDFEGFIGEDTLFIKPGTSLHIKSSYFNDVNHDNHYFIPWERRAGVIDSVVEVRFDISPSTYASYEAYIYPKTDIRMEFYKAGDRGLTEEISGVKLFVKVEDELIIPDTPNATELEVSMENGSLAINSPEDQNHLVVYDLTGKVLYENDFNSKTLISSTDFSNQTVFVLVTNEKAVLRRKLFIKP